MSSQENDHEARSSILDRRVMVWIFLIAVCVHRYRGSQATAVDSVTVPAGFSSLFVLITVERGHVRFWLWPETGKDQLRTG